MKSRCNNCSHPLVNVGYYVDGKLVATVSKDSQGWQPLVSRRTRSSRPAAQELFPAQRIFISLKAEASKKVGAADSDPGSFQIHSYEYKASVSGSPTDITGSTRYVHSSEPPAAVAIDIVDIGDALPGGKNQAQIAIANFRQQAISVVPSVTISKEGCYAVSTQPSVAFGAEPDSRCPTSQWHRRSNLCRTQGATSATRLKCLSGSAVF